MGSQIRRPRRAAPAMKFENKSLDLGSEVAAGAKAMGILVVQFGRPRGVGCHNKKRTSKIEKQDEPKIEQPNVQIIVHKYSSFIEGIGNLSVSISSSKVTLGIS